MASFRTPSLRRHKPSQQGVVTLNGHDHYLGPWPKSSQKPPAAVQRGYDALIAEWLAGGRQLPPKGAGATPTVALVIDRFWPHVEEHYRRPDGTPTSEVSEFKYALRVANHLYADLPASDFSPLKLEAVRQLMVNGYRE